MNKLEFQVTRTSAEPVTRQGKCFFKLHDSHIELIIDYDFTSKINVESGWIDVDDVVRMHLILPKAGLSIMRSTYSHSFDPTERGNSIELISAGIDHWVYMDNDTCNDIFKKIRAWLLKIDSPT